MNLFTSQKYRQLISIILPCIFGWIVAYLAITVLQEYGLGLFYCLPTVLGASTTIMYGYKNEAGRRSIRLTAYMSLIVFCIGLLTFAFEGVICIVMSAPLGLLFTWFGYRIGLYFINGKRNGSAPAALIILLVSVPAVMGFEYKMKHEPVIKTVSTRIEIKASPETVWKNVIEFPQLDEPTEFIFKTGIAYPINAQIEGQGVGAIRHCNFSTGSFVEPITTWDEPRLLQFSVTEQPEPMKELSPYDLHPNHLHGYWVSKQGQFKLTKLSNGNTLLEGTTWYQNRIRPDFYWTIWSDNIVHTIHERVLRHIKAISEA